ncbi:MAG TPA: helicase-related protein, partial [Planctomycetota bacterium]|nr:helicase-related protein [Planctomycetota bacterium]
GMVIIDEEQRFGVEHKERLKKLRLTVDILTMTATPIPRTLHMSLIGLRDISNLSQPPADRKAVATKICKWDVNQIRRSVLREINRGGQVFFIHNRVNSLYSVKKRLEAILPEVRIGIGHGKMDEHELAAVMFEFINGRIDLLLATTIIESGLDIPNANTMFVDRADKFGLADLHQLRGRVGRSERKAYAYFLIDETLPPNARGWERLKAIEEFDGLGAGFNLAMRDLEIRGAGNILGAEQSGNIADIGYELYTRILEKVVKTAKGEEALDPVEITVDLRLNASFPEGYLADDDEALETYRKLSLCRTREDADDVMGQVIDMSGPAPAEVCRVFCQARLRILSQQARTPYVGLADGRLQVRAAGWTFELLKRALLAKFRDVRVLDDETVTFPIPGRDEESPYTTRPTGGRSRDFRSARLAQNSRRSAQDVSPAPAPAANQPKPWSTRLDPKTPAAWPQAWRALTWAEAQLWELCEEVLATLGDFRTALLKENANALAVVPRLSGADSAEAGAPANTASSSSISVAALGGDRDENSAPPLPVTDPNASGAPASTPPPTHISAWPDDDDFAPRRSKREHRVGNPPPARTEPPAPPSPTSLAAETLSKKAGNKLSRGRPQP